MNRSEIRQKLFYMLVSAHVMALVMPPRYAFTQNFTSSNLPIVLIETNGQTIENRKRITAEMKVIDNGPGNRNLRTDIPNNYDGLISIEIRGSSSTMFPKKQYALETQTESGENNNVPLLGLPEENDWILYAPYSDKSLIRNVLEYELARRMGRYASRTKLCEMVLNGDYQGLYVLLEKIKEDKNRVPVATLNPDETTGDDVTGGYIIKIDKWDGEEIDGWYSPYLPYPGSPGRIYYQYHEPRPDDIVEAQKAYIRNHIDDIETALYTTDYSDPENSLPDVLDIPSFVDFFILNEIGRNVDGYRLSTFMYKDKDSKGGKLTMGPVWDFNLAFGNANYYNGGSIVGWQVDFKGYNDGFQIPFWWQKLLQSDAFRARIYARWKELRSGVLNLDQVNDMIDSLVTELSEAQVRNFIRWPVLGKYVWPNLYVYNTYEQEIGYLKEWIAYRFEWMDQNIPRSTAIPDSPATVKHFLLYQNYPNPFNTGTVIRYKTGSQGTVTLLPVDLTIYDIIGRKITTLVSERQPAGDYAARWDASGYPCGLYYYRLIVGSENQESGSQGAADGSITRKMILMK